MTLDFIQSSIITTHKPSQKPQMLFGLSFRTHMECSDSEVDCTLDMDDVEALVARLNETLALARIQQKALQDAEATDR